MAGAPGFEPGIAGPKPAALPLGYAPQCGEYRRRLPAFSEEEEQRDDREDRDHSDREELQDPEGDRRAEAEQLRRCEEPACFPDQVGTAAAAAAPPEGDPDRREDDGLPP